MVVAPGHRRLVAAVIAGGLVVGALGMPPAPAQARVSPSCTVGDTVTQYHKTSDWYRSVLDTRLRLPASYHPTDLVSTRRSGAGGYGRIRRIAIADFTAMFRAARKAKAAFAVQSAYRSYATQKSTFWYWVRLTGYQRALLSSARPGHSEHQLGTTVDLQDAGRRRALVLPGLGAHPHRAPGSRGTAGATAGS